MKIIWKKLTEKFTTNLHKTPSSIRAFGYEDHSPIGTSQIFEKVSKAKQPLLPGEIRKFQLMAEMDRSIGIEYWIRKRKCQLL